MTIRILWVLACVAGACVGQGAPSKPKRTKVPGTSATIVLPAGFSAADGAPGFAHAASGATIVVTEVPGPFSALALAFSPPALQAKGMRVVSRRAGMFAGHSGVLVHTTQLVLDRRIEKRVLLIGDDKASLMVNATVGKEHAKALDGPLHAAVTSVEWARGGTADPFASAGFRITAEPFRFAGRSGDDRIFTADGGIPVAKPGDPMLVVRRSTAPRRVDAAEPLARAHLATIDSVKEPTDIVATPITVDGMDAVEITANATITRGDHPASVYQLLALDPGGGYFLVVGIVGRDRANETMPRFRKSGRSLKRAAVRPTVDAKRARARADLATLCSMIALYETRHGALPARLDDLVGDFIKRLVKDPWGNDYVYERLPKHRFELRCLGADGKPGGAGPDADIVRPRR